MNEEKVKASLRPDHHSKSAYAGRIIQKEMVEVFAEDGTPIQKEVTFYISWASIEKMLGLVAKRAGIEP